MVELLVISTYGGGAQLWFAYLCVCCGDSIVIAEERYADTLCVEYILLKDDCFEVYKFTSLFRIQQYVHTYTSLHTCTINKHAYQYIINFLQKYKSKLPHFSSCNI